MKQIEENKNKKIFLCDDSSSPPHLFPVLSSPRSLPPSPHTLPLDCQDKRCCSCTPARCWFWFLCSRPLSPSLWCHIRLHCNYRCTGSVCSATPLHKTGQSYLESTVSRSEFTWCKMFKRPWHRLDLPVLTLTLINMRWRWDFSFVNITVVYWKDEWVSVYPCFSKVSRSLPAMC